ncbi:hypothetical protein GCWU000325_00997 [Alloprevotella tannerae ATCC 51259]|uniref:Uncharacterized protein n=1 Tax=Alloprevotella tannerae ATCC 51259 TaxID=626522 RepID=C9LFL4_9BACT|nr:hypothetical protein GCWU000325_00997 [Alloprevotella tannerae ATCC 51259]
MKDDKNTKKIDTRSFLQVKIAILFVFWLISNYLSGTFKAII